MKSEAIKDIFAVILEGKGFTTIARATPLTLDEMNTLFLGEIAYQFAILNEHLATVDSHVFGDDRLKKKDK